MDDDTGYIGVGKTCKWPTGCFTVMAEFGTNVTIALRDIIDAEEPSTRRWGRHVAKFIVDPELNDGKQHEIRDRIKPPVIMRPKPYKKAKKLQAPAPDDSVPAEDGGQDL